MLLRRRSIPAPPRASRRNAGVVVCLLVCSMLFASSPASADAVFQTQWGTASLRHPYDVATDDVGNVYVTDSSSARIRTYDSTGTQLLSWGGSGSGDGQFNFPRSIAVADDGSVYVADEGNNRIQKFAANGDFITKWGTAGAGQGQFNRPTGVDVDAAGNVYVADSRNNRVQIFDSAGGFVASWGTLGAGDGQFDGLTGIAVSSGNVYVSEVANRRVQRLSTDGTYITKWPILNVPGNLDTDAAGNVFVPDANTGDVTKYSPSGQTLLRWGRRGSGDGQFEVAQGVAVDAGGFIYVADTGNNRIQKFDSAAAYVAQWGLRSGEFANPWGIATDSRENVYVVDNGNNRIQKFTSAGAFLTAWGSRGSTNGQFNYPQSIAVDSQDNVYVTDGSNYRVQKFTSTGTHVTSWGSSGSGNGQFGRPQSVAVGPGDRVYVTDRGNNRVQVFDADGVFQFAFGSTGTGDGQFQGVTGIAVDHLGNAYVVDEDNHRIQKFAADGTFLKKWNGSPAFTYVREIDVDDDGHVFVADAGGDRIQMFDSEGNFMERWGSRGSGTGQFQFPQGVAAGRDGRIYVTDWGNHRVQRFVIRHALTVTRGGNGSGGVTSSSPGIDCGNDCSETYDHGGSVTLTAAPDASSTFTGWGGACSGTGSCQVTMDQAKSVTATFTLKTYALTVSKAGPGTGSLTSTPTGINCGSTCSATFNHGTTVTLTPTADSGFAFGGWSGDCTGSAACNVSMTQARAVTATFDDVAAPTSVVGAPTATTYDAAGWAASCSGDGGLCGTASDNAGPIAAVQWTLRRGTGLYWDGTAFAAPDPVFHEAVVTPTGDTTASWSAAFPFTQFPATDDYTATVRGRDAAGNAETPVSVAFGAYVPRGASITISQNSQPDSPASFGFTGDLGTFELVDNGVDPTLGSKTFVELSPGTYAVQQGRTKQWSLDGIECSGASSSTVHLKSRSATLHVQEGDSVHCTFATSPSGKGKPPGGGRPG